MNLKTLSAYEYLYSLQKGYDGNTDFNVSSDMCELLSASILAGLPDNQRRLLEDFAFGVLPFKNVNAFTIQLSSGGRVIAINYGLMSFLNTLNKILLCRLSNFGLEPIITLEDASIKAKEAIDFFYYEKGNIPRWAVSNKRILVSSSITMTQMAFTIGHEVAHHLLGHLNNFELEGIKIDIHGNQAKAISYKKEEFHKLEFNADERGAELIMEQLIKKSNSFFTSQEPLYTQASIDIFFTYLIFLQKVVKTQQNNLTHPSPEIRRTELRRRYINRMSDFSRKIAQEAEMIFEDMAKLLNV